MLAEHVTALTRNSVWKPVASVPVAFRTFHPQGMVKIGETFFVSSVEVRNRDTGDGTGHLFHIDSAGNVSLTDLKLGEGPIYHPGGIDFDGTSIWVPVAEYRPDSRSIIYRVDPEDDEGDRGPALRGSHRRDRPQHRRPHAARRELGVAALLSVDARSRWEGSPTAAWRRSSCVRSTPLTISTIRIASTPGRAACFAPASPRCASRRRRRAFRLGGIDLIDLRDGRPVHQVPVLLWTAGGLDMTHNPVWLEPTATGLRGYFMPEDDKSTIYVYDVDAR